MPSSPRGPDSERRLVGYHAATAKQGPNKLLLRALPYVKGTRAVDLGCGMGPDTLELSRRGYSVLAIDSAPRAVEAVKALRLPDVSVRRADFRKLELRPRSFDLVHACMSLPFAGPQFVPPLLHHIARWLRPEGVLSCHLLGVEDSWNTPGDTTAFHTREELDELLRPFDIIDLWEMFKRQPDGGNAHIFGVIARTGLGGQVHAP